MVEETEPFEALSTPHQQVQHFEIASRRSCRHYEGIAMRKLSNIGQIGRGYVGLILLLAVAGCGKNQQPPAPNQASTGQNQAMPAAPSAAPINVDDLLKLARKAESERRLVQPAGDNALESYLKALRIDPNNLQAAQAMVDIFPQVATVAEREIAQKNFPEAERILLLLEQASPGSYTVNALRAKLVSGNAKATQQQPSPAQPVSRQKPPVPASPAGTNPAASNSTTMTAAQNRPATVPEVAPSPAGREPVGPANQPQPQTLAETISKPPAQSSAQLPQPQTASPLETKPAETNPISPASATAQTNSGSKSTGQARPARIVNQVVPNYPLAAARKKVQGWVEVEFTVGKDGKVVNVHVVAAKPNRVFDKEAISAVRQWRFDPALQDGAPVETTLRRRVAFKL